MKTFVLKKEDPIVIYGAAYIGRDVCLKLKNLGYNVICFFDIRAEQIQEEKDVPVMVPDAYNGNRAETVVFVATGNPLSVANKLKRIGYSKIIYDSKSRFNCTIPNRDEISYFYNSILNGLYDGEKIACYDLEKMDMRLYDDAFVSCDKDEITAYVPVELLFVKLEERVEHIYFKYYELIRYLEAYEGDYDYEFLLRYSDKAPIEKLCGYEEALSPEERRVMTQTTINAYNLQLNYGVNLFDPIRLTRGDMNRFFLDEKDAFFVCFLIVHGMQRIKAVVAKKDYNVWLNEMALQDVKEYFFNHDLLTSYTLLEHPCLYHFPAARDIGKNNRLFRISEYFAINSMDISDKRILDVGAYYGAISRFFYRQGAKVTSVEYNEDSCGFCKLLNDLMYCSEIENIMGGAQELNRKKEYDITIMLTVLYWHLNTEIGLELITAVDNMTKEYLIWESGDEIEKEKQFIKDNSSFNHYHKICDSVGTGKVRELGIWTR